MKNRTSEKYNNKNELEKFMSHMAKNQLAPAETIIADSEPHLYDIKINGKSRQGIYSATPYLFGDNPDGPALIGWYGLIDEVNQYNYSSSEEKKNFK